MVRTAEGALQDLDLQTKRMETALGFLRERRRHFERALHHARAALLAEASSGHPPMLSAMNAPTSLNDLPLRQAIFEALREADGPMTVGEIATALEKRGRLLTKNAREVIRIAMGRHKETF